MSQSSEDLKKMRKQKERIASDKDRIVADAMKQVEQAMRQVNMATKGSRRFTVEQGPTPDEKGEGIVINSGGLFGGKGARINIQSAQNVQIGNNNVMVVNQSRRSKPTKSRRKRYESSSSEEDSPSRQEPAAAAAASASSPSDHDLIINSERLVTDNDMIAASNFMGKSWRRIGRSLQLSDFDLEQIYTDNFREGGIMEVGYQVLRKWRQKSGRQATIGVLTTALCKIHSPEEVLKRFEP